MTTGERIRMVRKRLGLSMDDFASKIDGKAKSGTVANWETNKNLPNNNRLKRIAEIGDVTVKYLLEGEGVSVQALIDENKLLLEALQRACDSLGADIEDYL